MKSAKKILVFCAVLAVLVGFVLAAGCTSTSTSAVTSPVVTADEHSELAGYSVATAISSSPQNNRLVTEQAVSNELTKIWNLLSGLEVDEQGRVIHGYVMTGSGGGGGGSSTTVVNTYEVGVKDVLVNNVSVVNNSVAKISISMVQSDWNATSGNSSILNRPAVVDNLSSTSSTDLLSANQGKVLNDTKVSDVVVNGVSVVNNTVADITITQVQSNWTATSGNSSILNRPAVVDNLSSTSSTDLLSAKQGKVLNDTKQNNLTAGEGIILYPNSTIRKNSTTFMHRLYLSGGGSYDTMSLAFDIISDRSTAYTIGAYTDLITDLNKIGHYISCSGTRTYSASNTYLVYQIIADPSATTDSKLKIMCSLNGMGIPGQYDISDKPTAIEDYVIGL